MQLICVWYSSCVPVLKLITRPVYTTALHTQRRVQSERQAGTGTNTETQTHRDRHRDTETQRQTQRHRDRARHRARRRNTETDTETQSETERDTETETETERVRDRATHTHSVFDRLQRTCGPVGTRSLQQEWRLQLSRLTRWCYLPICCCYRLAHAAVPRASHAAVPCASHAAVPRELLLLLLLPAALSPLPLSHTHYQLYLLL